MRETPVVLVVAAKSGSGKTTLIERLVPALADLGIRTAIVKLTHHDVDPDTPGKDSRRLRDAGATAAVIGGPRITSLFTERSLDVPALARLAASVTETDLVLVEGGRDVPDLPRIEVVPSGAEPYTRSIPDLLAIVGDGATPSGVRIFGRNDIDALAAHLHARLLVPPADGSTTLP